MAARKKAQVAENELIGADGAVGYTDDELRGHGHVGAPEAPPEVFPRVELTEITAGVVTGPGEVHDVTVLFDGDRALVTEGKDEREVSVAPRLRTLLSELVLEAAGRDAFGNPV